MADNKHVTVIECKQKYFNLLPNAGICIVLSGALWCMKIIRVLLVPSCLTGNVEGRRLEVARHLDLCCRLHAELHGRLVN